MTSDFTGEKLPKYTISSLFHSLHWLPVKYRIKYKISGLIFKAINTKTCHYLHSLISHYQPS